MTRPAMPNDDYDAIEAAVMDTARGRWFLAEYARRNRTADTGLLLAAIERLEESLAARDQPPTPHAALGAEAVASSASSELFAVDLALPAPAEESETEETVDATWVIEDPPSTEALQVPVPEADNADATAPDTEQSEAAPSASVHTFEPLPAPVEDAPVKAGPLAIALHQAQDNAARAPAPEPARGSGAPPLAMVDPAELDALSFEEKSVYFA